MFRTIFIFLGFFTASLHACSTAWNTESGDWNVPSNWVNMCIPNGSGDVATLGTNPANPLTINLNIPVTLSALLFNQPYYLAPFYTIAGANTITLGTITVQSGVHEINVPIQGSGTLKITVSDPKGNLICGPNVDISGISMLFIGPGTMTLNSSHNLLTGNLMLQNGTYINNNSLPNTVMGVDGVMSKANDTTFGNGAVVFNINSGANSGKIGASIQSLDTFNMYDCIVTNTNSAVNNGEVGAAISTRGSMSINGSTISQLNTGMVLQNFGAGISGNDVLTINGGVITSQNSGIVQGNQSAGVVLLGNSCVVEAGVINILNDGHVTAQGNQGSSFEGNNFTMNGGKVTCLNSGTIDAIPSQGKAVGALVVGTASFTMNGGSIP